MGRCRNTRPAPNRGLTGVAHHPRRRVALVPEAGSSSKPADQGDTRPWQKQTTPSRLMRCRRSSQRAPNASRRARRPRWPIALVLAWAALAVADIAVFHSSLGANPSRTSQAVAAGAAAHRHAQATAPVPAPAKARAPARAARGPYSGQCLGVRAGAARARATIPSPHPWRSTRARPRPGPPIGTARRSSAACKPARAFLFDMGHPVTITSVQIILGSARGADLQVRTGKAPALTRMRPQASASDASGTVHLSLARPHRARYLLIWFTQLPPDSAGTFKASVYDVRMKGFSGQGHLERRPLIRCGSLRLRRPAAGRAAAPGIAHGWGRCSRPAGPAGRISPRRKLADRP